jgi:hypothetical protein
LRYNHDVEVPIEVVAQALLGAHRTAQLLPKVLERIFPDIMIERVTFFVSDISQHSPLDGDFFGRIYYDVQESLQGIIAGVGKRTGLQVMETHKKGISTILIVLIMFGAAVGYLHIFGTPNGAINGDYNTVINIAGEQLGQDPALIHEAITSALDRRDREQLARDAHAVLAPSKVGAPAQVIVNDEVTISSSSVAAVQRADILDEMDSEEYSQMFERIDLFIRATDLDRTRTGWAGIVDINGKQRRIRMVIVPGIDLADLQERSGRGPIKSDIEVFFRKDRADQWVPYVMHLYKVHDDGQT